MTQAPSQFLLAAFTLSQQQFHALQLLVKTPTPHAHPECSESELRALQSRGLIHRNRGGLWVVTLLGCTFLQALYYAQGTMA